MEKIDFSCISLSFFLGVGLQYQYTDIKVHLMNWWSRFWIHSNNSDSLMLKRELQGSVDKDFKAKTQWANHFANPNALWYFLMNKGNQNRSSFRSPRASSKGGQIEIAIAAKLLGPPYTKCPDRRTMAFFCEQEKNKENTFIFLSCCPQISGQCPDNIRTFVPQMS